MQENLVLCLFLSLPLLSGLALLAILRARKPAPARLFQIVSFNLALTVFLLGSLLAGGEIYYRFLCDRTDALDFTKVSERWFQRHYHQNGFGCRDSIEYSFQIKPGKRRITFLGDSFAAGHGIKDVEQRFANKIRAAHPNWEIHVIARPGFDTTNEIKSIEAITQNGYELDQVVLVYCLNDLQDLLPKCMETVQQVYAEADHSGWLRKNSYFLNLVWQRFIASTNPALKSYYLSIKDGYQSPVWQQQKERLLLLKQLVQSHHGSLSVVTFPFLQSLGRSYAFQSVHDQLGDFWKQLGVPHLDLLLCYSNLPPNKLVVNRFDPHPNEFANSLAAAAVDTFLGQAVGELSSKGTNSLSTSKFPSDNSSHASVPNHF
jgi:hypothetical protein